MSLEEKEKLSPLSIGLIITVVLAMMIGVWYLFFMKDEEVVVEQEAPKGSTVSLSQEDKEALKETTENLLTMAGSFGLIEEMFDSEHALIVREHNNVDDPLFSEYFVTRSQRLQDLRDEGLIFIGGKADFNTSRWDDVTEPHLLMSYEVVNIEMEIPDKAKEDTLLLATVPVTYDSVIRQKVFSLSQAPTTQEEIDDAAFSASKYVVDENDAVLTFAKTSDGWELYSISTKNDPISLVLWGKPDPSRVLDTIDGQWEYEKSIPVELDFDLQ